VKGVLELHAVDDSTEETIDEDEYTRLRVLRRDEVAINGHSPSPISARFHVARETIHHRSKLGAQEKDVHSAVFRRVVQVLRDIVPENAFSKITYEISLDINIGAALKGKR
jgi:hypothetical protein